MTPEGLTRFASPYGVGVTIDHLAAAVVARDMTVFARIDHAAGAAAAGLSMRPAELLIFGNARGGTPLMQAASTIAIDLPLKALAWQDDSGSTWLGFNDPAWLAQRHALPAACDANLQAIAASLLAVASEAIATG